MTPRAAKPTRATIPNQRLLDRWAERRWPAVVNARSMIKAAGGQRESGARLEGGRAPTACFGD